MKQSDITNCVLCGQSMGHDNLLLFYKVTIRSMMLDVAAINRAHGMEQMMGGGSFGAMVQQTLGRDEDLAVKTGSDKTFCVCLSCATVNTLCALNEASIEKERKLQDD